MICPVIPVAKGKTDAAWIALSMPLHLPIKERLQCHTAAVYLNVPGASRLPACLCGQSLHLSRRWSPASVQRFELSSRQSWQLDLTKMHEGKNILFPIREKCAVVFFKVTRWRKRWKKSESTKSDPAGSAASGISRNHVLAIGSRLAEMWHANRSGTLRNVPSGTGRIVPTLRPFIFEVGWSHLGVLLLHRVHLLPHHAA